MRPIEAAPEEARRCFESRYRAQMARRLDEALGAEPWRPSVARSVHGT